MAVVVLETVSEESVHQDPVSSGVLAEAAACLAVEATFAGQQEVDDAPPQRASLAKRAGALVVLSLVAVLGVTGCAQDGGIVATPPPKASIPPVTCGLEGQQTSDQVPVGQNSQGQQEFIAVAPCNNNSGHRNIVGLVTLAQGSADAAPLPSVVIDQGYTTAQGLGGLVLYDRDGRRVDVTVRADKATIVDSLPLFQSGCSGIHDQASTVVTKVGTRDEIYYVQCPTSRTGSKRLGVAFVRSMAGALGRALVPIGAAVYTDDSGNLRPPIQRTDTDGNTIINATFGAQNGKPADLSITFLTR